MAKNNILYGATVHKDYAAAIAAINLVQMYESQPVISLYTDTENETKAVLVVGTTEGKGSSAYEIIATSADPSYIFKSITELEQRINSFGSGFSYKGTKQTYEELPEENNNPGDIYHVVEEHSPNSAGTNYAWNGEEWEPLSGEFDLSNYVTKEDFADYLKDVEEIKDTFKKISFGSYTINFGQDSTMAEDFNLIGRMEIVSVESSNVASCTLGTHNIIPGDELPITVQDGEKLVWTIEREVDDAVATLGIKIKITK